MLDADRDGGAFGRPIIEVTRRGAIARREHLGVAMRRTLGRRIARVRTHLHLTQGAFATLIGVTRNTAIRYELGAIPRAEVLDRIAQHGGVTVEWLLHGPRVGERSADKPWDEAVEALRAVWRDRTRRTAVMDVLRALRPPDPGR